MNVNVPVNVLISAFVDYFAHYAQSREMIIPLILLSL